MLQLQKEYQAHSPVSAALNNRAERFLVDGGSHSLRLISPFPPRIRSAKGAYVIDEDDHRILDFWQGHHANILGHNSEVVTSSLAQHFAGNSGLLTGFTDKLQIETAEILCKQTGAERVRFTTSGSLATMYSILLAKAFTGRDLVMKVGGGWHGAQPWGLKGVDYHSDTDKFQHVDSEGLSHAISDEVVITGFNNIELLQQNLKKYGEKTACFIMEPFIGAGGFLAADPEFVRTAFELTRRYGILLIFDEVISGFRFRAGNTARLYGVQPDLTTYGKVIGGGMPISAVAGRADVLELTGRAKQRKVKFSGGTYCAHPGSLLAAKVQMQYLIDNEDEIYPKINDLGEKTRHMLTEVFAAEGIYVQCTGYGNDAIPGSSLAMLHFPLDEKKQIRTPADTRDPSICDTDLGHTVFQLLMLLEDIHVVHGLGSLSTAHSENEIELLRQACRKAAVRLKGERTATIG
jgi:glutamate-1-semialdehyde 2,1-aminomutase